MSVTEELQVNGSHSVDASPSAASTETPISSKIAADTTPVISTPAEYGSKPCSLCSTPRNVLIRCQIDDTKKWHFVCTGNCWSKVSGGMTGGDADHPLYRYGGTWKNKHVFVSAKIKGRAREENKLETRQSRPYKKSRKGGQKEGRELRDVDIANLDEEQDISEDGEYSWDDEEAETGVEDKT